MKVKIDAIGLFVKDMKTMVEFYRDVMGFKTDWDGARNADLVCDNVRLIMFGRDDFEDMVSHKFDYPKGMNGTMEIAFEADNFADVDKQFEKLIKAGAKAVLPPTDEPWGQRTCYVSDPEGNLLEIGSFNK